MENVADEAVFGGVFRVVKGIIRSRSERWPGALWIQVSWHIKVKQKI